MAVDLLEQTVVSGITPLQTEYHAIKQISNNKTVGYRTVLRISSVDLGVLYPNQYRIVTNRNAQCIKLAIWCFKKMIADISLLINDENSDDFVSIYIPTKMLLKGELEKLLNSLGDEAGKIIPKIMFEFSSDILMSDSLEISKKLAQIKKIGVKLMLSEFGDEFCPLLRLNGLPFDMVVLDASLTDINNISSFKTSTVAKLINDLNMDCVIENTKNSELINKAYVAGSGFYIDSYYKSFNGVHS